MRVTARAPSWRLLCAWGLAAVTTVLSGCSGGTRAGATITGPVGAVGGVALTTNTGVTQVQQGGQLIFTASVTNDVNNAGVTWALSGADSEHVGLGTLTAVTTTTATYTAPTGVTGATAPTITATSIANPASYASGPIVVFGSPVLNTPVLFPGNANTPYSASISVSGGLAPYTWTLASGTVPPGLTLGTTNVTTGFTTLSGTPTTAGTYTFQVTVTDASGLTSTTSATLIINAAAACLLNGQYAILYTGFSSAQFAARASSLTITTAGTVTGYHDLNYYAARVAESVTGTCTTTTANDGNLTITGATSSPTYDFAVTTAYDAASNGFTTGRVQVTNGGDAEAGNGLIVQQDPTAFSLGSLAGTYAIGTLGAQSATSHMGLAGVVTFDGNGNVTGGHADSNGSTPLTYAAVSGTATAPDANGRGTLTLTASGQTFHFAYYIVNAGKVFLIGTDAEPALAGFMTRQGGTIAPGAFDSTALTNPAVLTLWGAVNTTEPNTALGLGRLSNANPGGGTVDLLLDCAYLDAAPVLAESIPGASYTVSNDGHATLALTSTGCDGTSNRVARTFALYLDGASNGYVVEHGSPFGTAGMLEFQAPGPFDNTIPGLFVSGTQYPQDAGPVLLLPQVIVAYGSISFTNSSASNGFALDPTSGRGFGTLTAPGEAVGVITLYPVNPNKVVMLRQGYLNRSAAIEWLGAN